MTTDPTTLSQWKDHPVPWVARWTGQKVEEALSISLTREGVHIGYKNGRENRESSGVLWLREGLNRSGEPEFGQVSAYRQRLSMTRRRCQVCGEHIQEDVIRWLMGRKQFDISPAGEPLTVSPPTCSECIPLALELCPFLKGNETMILKVLEYEPWGVHGDAVVMRDPDGKPVDVRQGFDEEMRPSWTRSLRIQYGRAAEYAERGIYMPAILAKQQVVRLTKFTEERP